MYRVNDFFIFVNFLCAKFSHLIKIIVGYHILKKVFLAPSAEHSPGNNSHVYRWVSSNDACLMSACIKPSYLPEMHTPKLCFLFAEMHGSSPLKFLNINR